MPLFSGERHAAYHSLSMGIPPRSTQSGKSRHKINAAVVGHRGCKLFYLGRTADKLQVVGHPFYGSPGTVDVPLESVEHLALRREPD